jgi:hypothetical protein
MAALTRQCPISLSLIEIDNFPFYFTAHPLGRFSAAAGKYDLFI